MEPERPFVCPWCGASFPRRFVVPPANLDTGSLEGHWRTNPECSANRNVNNPTAEKTLEPPAELIAFPGPHLLEDDDGV